MSITRWVAVFAVFFGLQLATPDAASAQMAELNKHHGHFHAAHEKLMKLYAQHKALSQEIAAVAHTRAAAEASVEAALRGIENYSERHGLHAEHVFQKIHDANLALEKAHLAALEAKAAAEHAHAAPNITEQ